MAGSFDRVDTRPYESDISTANKALAMQGNCNTRSSGSLLKEAGTEFNISAQISPDKVEHCSEARGQIDRSLLSPRIDSPPDRVIAKPVQDGESELASPQPRRIPSISGDIGNADRNDTCKVAAACSDIEVHQETLITPEAFVPVIKTKWP